MDAKTVDRVNASIEREGGVDQWWAAHKKALHEMIEGYKTWVSVELRRTQVQLARVTEERDIAIKEVIKLRATLRKIKEAFENGH